MRAALRRVPRIDQDSPHYAEGYRRGQEYVGFRVREPEKFRRPVNFIREIEINEMIESFVLGNSEPRGRAGEIVAWIALGDHFHGDGQAAKDWWERRGGDPAMPNFVAGFLTGARDAAIDDD
jgi:hypothetical protein